MIFQATFLLVLLKLCSGAEWDYAKYGKYSASVRMQADFKLE